MLDQALKQRQWKWEHASQARCGVLQLDGAVVEGGRWLQTFQYQDATAALSPAAHAKALHAAGNLLTYQGNDDGARERYEASLAIRRQLGDKQGIEEVAE